MDNKKFIEAFNREFGYRFFPEGFAHAKVLDNGSVSIRIADRDMQVTADGDPMGAGSLLCGRWKISENEKMSRISSGLLKKRKMPAGTKFDGEKYIEPVDNPFQGEEDYRLGHSRPASQNRLPRDGEKERR